MDTKLVALLVPLVAMVWAGCDRLWGSMIADNPVNCVVTPGICAPTDRCDPELERCLRVTDGDGGTASCPDVACPTGQSCDLAAQRCVPTASLFDVLAVRPRTGPLTGLATAIVEGSAFTAPATVRIGGIDAPAASVLAPDRIAVAVPAAARPGLVSVEVSLSSGMRISKPRQFGYAWSTLGFTVDPTLDTLGQTAGPVLLTDLNNDQRLDVAVAHGTRVSTFLGSASGLGSANTTTSASTSGALSGRLVAGRLNADAFADLALLDPTSGTVLALLGDGQGRFGAPTSTMVGSSVRDIALADMDGDQLADLLVARDSTDQLVVYGGRGDGGFRSTPLAAVSAGRGPCSIAVGLFDADTRPDVALVLCQDAAAQVRLNVGGSQLLGAPRSLVTLGGRATPRRVLTADMNADGRTDLVISNSDQSSVAVFSVLLGQGTGDFATGITAPADSPSLETIQVVDVDGDGFPDVLAAPTSGMIDGVRVLLGDGFGGLRGAQRFSGPAALNANLRNLVAGDVTGDDKADILFTASTSGVAVLRNTSQ